MKYPERENVSSPPSTAKIKNAWSHPLSKLLHGVVSKHMRNLNFQLEEKKIWRKLQSMNVKFVFANTVMTNKSRPKRCVQHVAYLRPIKDALPFLAATQ
jgi:hypothetical protein